MTLAERTARRTVRKVVRWVLRIYALAVAAVALMIAFGPDPYADPSATIPFIDQIGLASMAIAVLGLVTAWRWELWGGLVAILGVLGALASSCAFGGACPSFGQTATFVGILGLVLALPGALFIWLHAERRPAQRSR